MYKELIFGNYEKAVKEDSISIKKTYKYENKAVVVKARDSSVYVDWYIDERRLKTAYFPAEVCDKINQMLSDVVSSFCLVGLELVDKIAYELSKYLPDMSEQRYPILKHVYITVENKSLKTPK